jgi:hypothetical protein
LLPGCAPPFNPVRIASGEWLRMARHLRATTGGQARVKTPFGLLSNRAR